MMTGTCNHCKLTCDSYAYVCKACKDAGYITWNSRATKAYARKMRVPIRLVSSIGVERLKLLDPAAQRLLLGTSK